MKKPVLFLVPAIVLMSLVMWVSPHKNTSYQSPCDDPEYLALKAEIARADPKGREALLKRKGALLGFLEEERAECLRLLSENTPMSESQRATAIALHGTQIAQEAKNARPTPLVPSSYEGPYPTIPIPTIHSDEFLPSPISWRLLWQGDITIIQVGVIGESGVSQGKSGLLIWRPHSKQNPIEIVPLADRPLHITRIDIVTVCKPFVVVAGHVKQVNAKPYIWVYDLLKKSVRSVTRSQVPCWDPSYEQRDPTNLGN